MNNQFLQSYNRDTTQFANFNLSDFQLQVVRNCTSNKVIADYIYDHNGKRIAKKEYTNGVLKRIVYSMGDGFEKVKLASNSAIENTTYYTANDEVVARKNPDGNRTYYHGDHLGSNAVLTNQSGTVVEKTSYEPYGEVKTGGKLSKFQYTGQEKDSETGLNYYDARYYDSHIQRFTQADTLLPDVYDPQQLNRYSYVNNNPIKYTDPTGHCPQCIGGVVVLGAEYYLLALEIYGFTNGVISSNDKSFEGKMKSGVVGMQTAVESSQGQLAIGIATVGMSLLTPTGQNYISKNIQAGLFGSKSAIPQQTKIDKPYQRPSYSNTKIQKQSVQGKPCSNCGRIEPKMYSNHKYPLVKEWYETGKIDVTRMRSLNAVNPHCPTCSHKEGGLLSGYSKIKAKSLGLK